MGQQRTRRRVLVLCLAASCTTEPVADVGELSAGENEVSGTSSPPATSAADSESMTSVGSEASSGEVEESSGGGSDGPLLDVGGDALPGCANAAQQYMFLVTMEKELHRYDPETGMVESLGTADCPGLFVMAGLTIDRSGLLWAHGVDEEGYRMIYTLDPGTLACIDTGYRDPEGYTSGGIAFVADAPDSEEESLYVGMVTALAPTIPLSLARIDLATMEAEIVGEVGPVGDGLQLPDMTGTGDARLFGFFNSGPIVAEIEASAPTLVEEHLVDFMPGSPWAFAQWGARMWLFGNNGQDGSRVVAWDPSSGDIEQIDPMFPVQVVGAAVSTCAPNEPEG